MAEIQLPKTIVGALATTFAADTTPYVPSVKTLSEKRAKHLNKAQRETLRKMVETGKRLVRQPGGVWVLAGTHIEKTTGLKPTHVPLGFGAMPTDWCVRTPTMEALEARGLLQRANVYPESWKDERELTETGRRIGEGT